MQNKEQSINNPQLNTNRHRKWIASLQNITQIQQFPINQKLKKNTKYTKSINFDSKIDEHQLKQRKLLAASFKFNKKRINISSLQEKYIQSQAQLRKVNFHHKKIQIKKNSILRKQFQRRNKETNELGMERSEFDLDQIRRYNSAQFFDVLEQSQKNKFYLKRIKNSLIQSRKQVKSLYYLPLQCQVRKSQSQSNVEGLLKFSQKWQKISKHTKNLFHKYDSRQLSTNQLSKERQILLKMNSLGRYKQCMHSETKNPSHSHQASKGQCRQDIAQQMNQIDKKHKEQVTIYSIQMEIVKKQLNKLLYGQNSINDCPFAQQNSGKNSHKYIKMVTQQKQMLSKFKGQVTNKRKLLQKFSIILTNFKRHDKLYALLHKDDQSQ